MNVIIPGTVKDTSQQTSQTSQPEWLHRENPASRILATANPSRRRSVTVGQLYLWGFRLTAILIGASLLFVAAIYYGVINP